MNRTVAHVVTSIQPCLVLDCDGLSNCRRGGDYSKKLQQIVHQNIRFTYVEIGVVVNGDVVEKHIQLDGKPVLKAIWWE